MLRISQVEQSTVPTAKGDRAIEGPPRHPSDDGDPASLPRSRRPDAAHSRDTLRAKVWTEPAPLILLHPQDAGLG